MKTFGKGGIHPKEHKELSEDAQIEILPTPKKLVISLSNHIGKPCKLTIPPRTEINANDLIGDADSLISAPLHSPLKGKNAKCKKIRLPSGMKVDAVPMSIVDEQELEGDNLYKEIFEGKWPYNTKDFEAEAITKISRESGLVGLGGASFPTSVKLTQKKDKPVDACSRNLTNSYKQKKPVQNPTADTLVLNGAECEPYLTCNYRLMLEAPKKIISGALLAAKACGAKDIIIGIENNKPVAIAKMIEATSGTNVKIMPLKTRYPQGGEKQLVDALLGRKIPAGGLPLDIGVVVLNVATAASLAGAVHRGHKATYALLTVSGDAIETPKNILAPIGTSYEDILDFCGGVKENVARIISGGPMMGFPVSDLVGTVVTKATSGIIVLSEKHVRKSKETNCIKCGRCVSACPLNLIPTKIALAARFENNDLLKSYHTMNCMECGCCTYICPAKLPLVQLIRLGKRALQKEANK